MTDELQIQQQPSSTPYVLGAGAVGGAAAGVGTHFYTKPKYGSYEEILAEAKDEFNKRLDSAEGDKKTFLEGIKELREAKASAEAEYEDKLKAFKENYGVKDTDEIKDLVKKQGEYQNTIKELEAKAGDATVVATTVKKQPTAAIRQTTRDLNRAAEELKILKASNASKESIQAVQNRINNLETRLNGIYDSIIANTQFKGTEAEVNAAKKTLRDELQGYSQSYMNERDLFYAKKPEKGFAELNKTVQTEQKAVEDALANIKKLTANDKTPFCAFEGYDLSTIASDKKAFFKKTNKLIEVEDNKTRTLEKMLKNYNAAENKKVKTSFMDRLAWLITGKEIPSANDKKAVEEFINSLSPAEKKLLQGKEVTKETIETVLNSSKERAQGLRKAASTISGSNSAIEKIQAEIAKKQNAIMAEHKEEILKNVEGAKYDKDGFYRMVKKPAADGKTPKLVRQPITFSDAGFSVDAEGVLRRNNKILGKTPEFKPTEFKSTIINPKTQNVVMPKEIEVTLNQSTNNAQRIENARKQVADLGKQIEDLRGKLPKNEALPEEEALSKFLEQEGVKDKAEYATKKVEQKTKAFQEKWSKELESKLGKNAGWKLAAITAGGVVLGGIIGKLIAPKGEQA